jgi:hypothetical protein
VIDVSEDEGAGSIALQGTDEVNLGENVSLRADALLSGDGGVIEISSQNKVEFLGGISATGENPGTVTIDAPTVINNGVIDLGVENSEEEKVSDTEEEKAIASNSDTEEEKAIASNSDTEEEKTIASNSDTEEEKTIASDMENKNESAIASQKQTQILTANNPRLQPDESLGNENTQIEAINENNDRVIPP